MSSQNQMIGRSVQQVNYTEDSDTELDVCEEGSEMIDQIDTDVFKDAELENPEGLNKKKQYKKVLKSSERKEWEIDGKRSLPKGSKTEENCYYFYITLHPGMYHLIYPCISSITYH